MAIRLLAHANDDNGITTRLEAIPTTLEPWPCDDQLMTLAINLPAAFVQASVQIPLLGFRNVTAIFSLIPIQAVLFTCKFGIIVSCLPGINLTVRNTSINTGLLIIDALLNFIDTRMARIRHASTALSVGSSN